MLPCCGSMLITPTVGDDENANSYVKFGCYKYWKNEYLLNWSQGPQGNIPRFMDMSLQLNC